MRGFILLTRRSDRFFGAEEKIVQIESIFVTTMKVTEEVMARLADKFGVPTADLMALAFRLRCCEVIVRGGAIALITRFIGWSGQAQLQTRQVGKGTLFFCRAIQNGLVSNLSNTHTRLSNTR